MGGAYVTYVADDMWEHWDAPLSRDYVIMKKNCEKS